MASELEESAWGIIANAGRGNWDNESPDWKLAAKKWRDKYYKDKTLSSAEALYGFCGWLSSRERILSIGNDQECGQLANLIKEFCETNNLAEPRAGWEQNLIHPI